MCAVESLAALSKDRRKKWRGRKEKKENMTSKVPSSGCLSDNFGATSTRVLDGDCHFFSPPAFTCSFDREEKNLYLRERSEGREAGRARETSLAVDTYPAGMYLTLSSDQSGAHNMFPFSRRKYSKKKNSNSFHYAFSGSWKRSLRRSHRLARFSGFPPSPTLTFCYLKILREKEIWKIFPDPCGSSKMSLRTRTWKKKF